MLTSVEIPRGDWPAFFDEFSRAHDNWLITIEVMAGRSPKTEVFELPFAGITADTRRHDSSTITVFAGKPGEEHITHTIAAPLIVNLASTEDGRHTLLEIASEMKPRTVLRFRAA